MATEQHTVSDDGSRFLISDLCHLLESYLEKEQVQEVYRAYLFGAEAHEGQHRMSGEPYIYHPVAVARILAGMGLDYRCLMAAILHDVIEDTETAKDQLIREFGPEVAELVELFWSEAERNNVLPMLGGFAAFFGIMPPMPCARVKLAVWKAAISAACSPSRSAAKWLTQRMAKTGECGRRVKSRLETESTN